MKGIMESLHKIYLKLKDSVSYKILTKEQTLQRKKKIEKTTTTL